MSTPSFTSGLRAIKDPKVENLSVLVGGSPLRYHFIDDSLAVEGMFTEHILEGEGVHLGADVRSAGIEKGGMNLQLNKATDTPPNVAHVLKVTKGTSIKYYVVTASPRPNVRNNVVRVSPTVCQLINPFFAGLLDPDLGDTKAATFSKAGGDDTIDPGCIAPRTGGTKSFTATLEDGSALPAGIAINSSTGVISITAADVTAATLTIKVAVKDTLSTLPADHPWRELEGEATLILTITA